MAVARSNVHAHGCPKCRERFEDACSEPQSDPTCVQCRTGNITWPQMRENRRPKDCCRYHSRLVMKTEVKQFRLGSTCLWFICKTCARTFPFTNPTKEMSNG